MRFRTRIGPERQRGHASRRNPFNFLAPRPGLDPVADKRNDPKFVDRTSVPYAWMETVPARASSPGCSARMIKFASPPSEVMLEAPGVGREPSFKGVMRFGADDPGPSGMAPAGFTAFTPGRLPATAVVGDAHTADTLAQAVTIAVAVPASAMPGFRWLPLRVRAPNRRCLSNRIPAAVSTQRRRTLFDDPVGLQQ